MGVDYELFWTLNPRTLSPFIKAFSLKTKYDDRVAWQNGLYVRMAIASSFDKKAKYPDVPMLSKKSEEVVDPHIQQQIIKERFMRHAELLNNRFRKDGETSAEQLSP